MPGQGMGGQGGAMQQGGMQGGGMQGGGMGARGPQVSYWGLVILNFCSTDCNLLTISVPTVNHMSFYCLACLVTLADRSVTLADHSTHHWPKTDSKIFCQLMDRLKLLTLEVVLSYC